MKWNAPTVYAVKHKDNDIRLASRSGGIFTALSDEILDANGVIYGCVLSETFEAVYTKAEDKSIRDRMRGSKYVQSKLGGTFKQVRTDLDSGEKVLFSGTSCQVAGLRNFLGKEYDNLLCVDIVCHGVPSPKVWESYIDWQQKKTKKVLSSVDFRNKADFGWADHVESLYMTDGVRVDSKIYTNLFYSLNVVRPSCYGCPYKSVRHPGDITIADYWGIDEAVPGFNDNKGVSLVFVNSDTGLEYFNLAKPIIEWQETKIEECMMQKPLVAPYSKPENRDKFWNEFNSNGFEYVAKKYGGYGIANKVRNKLGSIKRKILG